MGKIVQASVDSIFKGQAHGDVASLLLNSGMDANVLRTNATLRKDEWKSMDEKVIEISRQRLIGVGDLMTRGLVYDITNGMGTTVLEVENASDMEAAEVDMDGATDSKSDRINFDIGYLPLPIVHRGFNINARVLESSRSRGQSLDTMQAGVAAMKVAEKVEEILFTGSGTYTFGGGTVYGYTDFPRRNTGSLSANWDASGDPGAGIMADVLAMKQASITDLHLGPWILYVPTAYDTVLDDDYSSNYSGVSIRKRLLEIGGIEDVKVADKLTANNVLLVEMQESTVRIVNGMQPTTLQWDSLGGMKLHFKVMAIQVPQLRADQDGRCGIQHWT